MDGDIQLELAGYRAVWRAVSDAGRAWVVAHQDLVDLAPEGIEEHVSFCDPLIEQAIRDGLVVMAGDVEVSLCS